MRNDLAPGGETWDQRREPGQPRPRDEMTKVPKIPNRDRDETPLPARRPGGRSTESVTLRDVARLAGVSPITVSRAFNRPDALSTETLAQVRAAVERLGYVPNLLAGGLATNRSRLVAAIVPSIVTSMFSEAVEALSDRLSEAGYEVLLGQAGFQNSREDKLVAAVLGRKPDAIFLTGITHSPQVRQQLLAARIPVVETWDLTPTPIDMVIGFSHEKVGRAVARFLKDKGYRRFAVISAEDERARQRRDGFLAGLAENGIGGQVDMETVEAPGTLELGRQALSRLIGRGCGPDVVFGTSDPLAQGILTEARVRGLRVPRDIAVMGFGDFASSAHIHPALTTVHFDRRRIGHLAAEAILSELEGHPATERVVDIGFEIRDRESA